MGKGEFMKEMLNNLPAGIVIFQGIEPYEVIFANQAFSNMVQYGEKEPEDWDQELWLLLHEDDRALIETAMSETRKRGCSSEFELRMQCRDGEYRWYVMRMGMEPRDGEDALFAMVIVDIHERKLMEEELYVQTERYKLLELITGELPFDLDVESGEMLISRKYLELCDRFMELEHFAKNDEIENMIYKQDMPRFRKAMEEAASQVQKGALELRLRMADAKEAEEFSWYRLTYKSISNVEGKIIRIVGRMVNINEEKLENEQMAQQMRKDSLTGLLTKNAVREEIEEYLASVSGGEHAMLVLAINRFKDMNDTFGHMFGDTVLISIAEKISSIFPEEELIGRVGGDKFVILMKDTKVTEVMAKAELLCSGLRKRYQSLQQEVEISCSVGISFFRINGTSYEELFVDANYAMYQAREEGKNLYKVAEVNSQMAGLRRDIAAEEDGDYVAVRLQDDGFLSSSFSLLAYAKDVNSSLDLLLERIGTRYELDVVSVLENSGDEQEFVQMNCWQSSNPKASMPEMAGRYGSWQFRKEAFDERGLLCLSSKEYAKRSQESFWTMVSCRFKCQDGRIGIIVFFSMEPERKWSKFEQETFLEISRIISTFVSLGRSQRESEYTIQALRSRDSLTGLYNEKAFREIAQNKISYPEPEMQYAVVFTDIREFSYVNENYGLEAGNQILRELGEQAAFVPNMISGRMHSDLFISLIWDDSRTKIQDTISGLMRDFTKMQQKKFPDGKLRLVAGIYFVEGTHEDIDTAIENANLTRKKLKQSTNESACQVYSDELRAQRESEKRITSEFESAMAERRFAVYIQPKFMLQTMELSGGEALVRWMKRDGGMEFPDEFIPVLEKSGQIVEMDFYVFEEVLKYLKKWEDAGKKMHRISVNFSRKHFEGKGIYHRIYDLVEKYQVSHCYIEIEITESLLVSGLDVVKTEMGLLREAGFAVAIDDFGTGYSSLSMLRDMPADVVKLDKSFLSEGDMEAERDFIEGIGALIRSVKEEIIFEGVETARQVDFLIGCGYRYGQGYLYDRPLPIDVFEEKYMS